MMVEGGYAGKILRVNLTNGTVQTQLLDGTTVKKFIGGRGYGARILYDENPSGVDPFDPDNRIIFFTSPFLGTSIPCSVKPCAVTKSPLSQTILMSLSGGYFGSELKFTGYDGIVITGRAEHPVYLQIHNDDVQIKDASLVWGKDTLETQDLLKDAFGDNKARVVTIGTAGEKLVRFASAINERRAFGRGGIGAVMGAKQLKAIIVRGTRPVDLFDKHGFDAIVKELRERFKSDEAKVFSRYGTSGVVHLVESKGIFPTRNYQAGIFEGRSKIDGVAREEFVEKHVTCYGCPVGCSVITVATDEAYKGIKSEGPEYETLWSFGGQCGNDNLSAIIAAENLCDRYGLDTISTGNCIGFAMECFEKGIITKDDTDGLELRFGDHEAMVEMVRKIGSRDGFGEILAEGVYRASQKIGRGSQKLAMHIKGSEMCGYDPRGAMGQGLSFATCPRGADHQKGLIRQEVFGKPPPIDRFAIEGKAQIVKEIQDEMAFLDAMGICCFLTRRDITGPADYAKLFKYVTGIEISEQDIWTVGERIFNLERIFNQREGFARKDDTLPERFLTEPLREGPSAGHTVPIQQLLDDYYRVREWDTNGTPTEKILFKLGLD
jgi:aldehyde:ferredoxin oxidoreductase